MDGYVSSPAVRARTLALAIAGVLGATPIAVSAQGLEEIVVTARKQEQSLQDVSISISAFTGDQLRELGISNAHDIAWSAPGVYATGSQGDANPLYTIRGIGLNDVFSNNNPTVGIYVDEVIQPFTPMMGFHLFDVSRVEVLKGPQGTLYGRNTTGGAINFISNRPGDEFDGYFRTGYGRFDRFEAEGAIGGPVADGWGARIAASTVQQSSGHMFNTVTGRRVGDEDKIAVRGSLSYEPSDRFDGLLIGSYGRDRSDSHLREHVGFLDGPFSGNLCQGAIEGRRDEGPCVSFLGYFDPTDERRAVENSSVYGQENDAKTYALTLHLNWHFAGMTLSSVTGYSEFDRTRGEDSDGTALIMLDTLFSDDIEAFSQELRLGGTTAGGIEWLTGAFLSRDTIEGGILQALDDHIFVSRVNTEWEQKSRSYAAFAHVDFPLADQLSVVGGLRYTREKKEITYDSFDLDPFGTSNFPAFGAIPLAGVEDSFTNNEVSGSIGLDYRLSEDVLLYGSFSRGFKTGGYKAAIAFSAAELEPFDQETLNAWEIGLKSTLADGSLRLNAAAYYYDWKDFQAFVTEVRGGINVIVLDNAGDAEVWGVEVDALWRPVDGLDLQLAANWMDTEVKRFNTIPGSPDATGNELANSPEWMLNGRVRYEFPLAASGMTAYVGGDAIYRSRVFYSLSNNGQNSQSGFWLLDARAGITAADGAWDVWVWGKNLTNKLYVSQSYDNTGGIFPSQNFLGMPRTWGINAQYNF